jgi:hypothetical protein
MIRAGASWSCSHQRRECSDGFTARPAMRAGAACGLPIAKRLAHMREKGGARSDANEPGLNFENGLRPERCKALEDSHNAHRSGSLSD